MAEAEVDAARGPLVRPVTTMTLRVSRDGGRTWGPTVRYEAGSEGGPVTDAPGRFPSCACRRCAFA